MGRLLSAHKRYAPQQRQNILDNFEVFCMQQEERLRFKLASLTDDECLRQLLPQQEFDPTNYDVEVRK